MAAPVSAGPFRGSENKGNLAVGLGSREEVGPATHTALTGRPDFCSAVVATAPELDDLTYAGKLRPKLYTKRADERFASVEDQVGVLLRIEDAL